MITDYYLGSSRSLKGKFELVRRPGTWDHSPSRKHFVEPLVVLQFFRHTLDSNFQDANQVYKHLICAVPYPAVGVRRVLLLWQRSGRKKSGRRKVSPAADTSEKSISLADDVLHLGLPDASSGNPPFGKNGATSPMAVPGLAWLFYVGVTCVSFHNQPVNIQTRHTVAVAVVKWVSASSQVVIWNSPSEGIWLTRPYDLLTAMNTRVKVDLGSQCSRKIGRAHV